FVAPATYLEWHAGTVREAVTYWNPAGPATAARSPEACVDEYAEILADSVRLQLLSDVPVGLFLSGGLDSALIAGIASRATRGLEAFTLVEPAITRTGDTAAAIELARHLDIPLHMVRVDED